MTVLFGRKKSKIVQAHRQLDDQYRGPINNSLIVKMGDFLPKTLRKDEERMTKNVSECRRRVLRLAKGL